MSLDKKLTPDEFMDLSNAYFNDCKSGSEPITMTGLALALGFSSRQSIYDYAKDKKYRAAVGRAKLIVENAYEKRLHDANCTGAIFSLKSFDSGVWGADQNTNKDDKEQKPITINFVDAVKSLNVD